MHDLTMEDSSNDITPKKAKLPEDPDFTSEPIIDIGSSSRCTVGTTRANDQKAHNLNEPPQRKETMDGRKKDSETKTPVKDEAATISNKVEVEAKQPAVTVWNIGHLRKRETTELEDGGFGLLPIKVNYRVRRSLLKGECSQVPRSPPKDLGKQAYIGYLDLLMKQLSDDKCAAEKWIDRASLSFPGDATFEKYKKDMQDLLRTRKWTASQSEGESTAQGQGMHKSMGIVVYEKEDTPDPYDACWESPTFIAEVDESLESEVKKSEERKSTSSSNFPNLGVDAPGFDLGISPEKPQSASAHIPPDPPALTPTLKPCSSHGSQDKGKKVTFSPVPMASYLDDTEEPIQSDGPIQPTIREHRRLIKLGDPLRSPYVQRCVDFNVTVEERRVHEWALGALRDTTSAFFPSANLGLDSTLWVMRTWLASFSNPWRLLLCMRTCVEELMHDLTMEDSSNDIAPKKGKAPEDKKSEEKTLKAYTRKHKRKTCNLVNALK
ncbi:hypothetical protein L6452_17860 [Arctium lappa]|uniref:Uncharacterized protein n=1 Tax=Arctium lappa TaxID=4217 RepID=A0ACB9C4U5_ARCLA|nr:hypothetical protein L6452_17860 [Arctium lappa]